MLISTAITQIRRALGRPLEAVLGDEDILLEIWENVSMRRAQLKLTNEGWQISRWNINVPAGTTTETSINRGDFGQVFLIHTISPGNPYHIRRTVDIVKLEQLSMYWSGPDALQIGGSPTPHVAQAFAPFNENGQWKIAWAPAHAQACTYQGYYTPGAAVVPPVFDDSMNFPIEEQNFFIIADCALNLFALLADKTTGLNAQQLLLKEVADKKYQQWSPIFEQQRWEGFRREQPMHRKIFGPKRGRGMT